MKGLISINFKADSSILSILYVDEYAPQLLRNTASANMATLLKEQRDTLQCALRFDQAQHVAYFVRSTREQETGAMVEKVMGTVAAGADVGGELLFEVSPHQPPPPGKIITTSYSTGTEENNFYENNKS